MLKKIEFRKMKKSILWILAVVITLSAVVYQRLTGPTYPKRLKFELNGMEYKLRLIRSHGGTEDAPVKLKLDGDIEAVLNFNYFPLHQDEAWKQLNFIREGNELVAKLPNQPPAGKLMYYITIIAGSQTVEIEKDSPVIIRFKGAVPQLILIPHVIFMFIAMFLANVAGLLAIGKISSYRFYTYLTLGLLTVGGMILGPLVQYYAFGDLWTGIPYGWDLTDNKTLIAFIFWVVAVIGQLKKERPYLTIIASIVILLIYSIPHSMFGSELDRTSGEVTHGFIQLISIF